MFDSLAAGDQRLGASVEVARVSLSPERAERGGPAGRHDRLLAGIRYDKGRDEIEVCIRSHLGRDHSIRFFLSSPRSVTAEEVEGEKLIRVSDANGVDTLIRLVELPGGDGHGSRLRLLEG